MWKNVCYILVLSLAVFVITAVFYMQSFQYAIDSNNIERARLLIEKGADINAKDKGGWTLLNWAIGKNNTEISRLLIEKGAAVNAKSNNGITPLYLAIEKYNTEISQLLIEKGADVNAKGNNGRTPLHLSLIHISEPTRPY